MKEKEATWMNPNKYTFLFDYLTDLIIQTPTQSSETTGPIRETMTVHPWCDPSGSDPPLPTHPLTDYRAKSLVLLSVHAHPPTPHP